MANRILGKTVLAGDSIRMRIVSIALLMVLGACVFLPSDNAALDVEATTTLSKPMQCGDVRWHGPGLPAPAPLNSEALAALRVLSQQTEGALLISRYEFSVINRSEDEMVLLGTQDGGSFADIRFERQGDADWQPTSYGTCKWTIDDYSSVAWILRTTPEPTDDVLRVTALNNCGLVEDSEDVIAVAEVTEATIQLLILERNVPKPEPGDAAFRSLECPLNLTVELDIYLDTKVDDRQIVGTSSEEEVFGQPTEEPDE